MLFAKNFDECIELIKEEYSRKDGTISRLRKENERLKEDHYKDNEMQEMKKTLDKMYKDYWRGFPISEEEEKAIEKWEKEHFSKVHNLKTAEERMRAGGCIGGSWSFRFTPTSLGTMGYIKCNICGEEFCFQDID